MLRVLLLLLMLLAPALAAQAAATDSQPRWLTLHEGPDGVSAEGKTAVFIDSSAQADIDAVRAMPLSQFQYPTQIRFNYDPRVYWLRFDIEAKAGPTWVLTLPAIALHDVRFFGPYRDGGAALQAPLRFGFNYPFSQRPLGAENIAIPLRLPADGRYTLYLRLRSDMPHYYTAKLVELGQHSQTQYRRQLLDGLCYGVLAAMLAYNLLLLLVFRDRAYGWYVLTVAFALLSVSSYNGHVAHYLFPDAPMLSQLCYSLAPPLWVLSGLMFGRHFLDMRRYTPKLYLLSHLLVALAAAAPIAGLLGAPAWSQGATELIAALGTVLMVSAAILAMRRHYHPARWYLAGQISLFITVLLVIAHNRGLINMPLVHALGLQIGAAVEVVIFALALGSRVRMMQLRNRELRARTHVLAAAAETDPLTGSYNRAGLQARADNLLLSGQHTLLLIDLNRFKPINDQYGHEAGDKVLIEVAHRLAEQVRDGDVVARLGGDEFVVLLNGLYERNSLSNIAVRLIDRIGMPISVDGRALEVGSSVGLALYPEHGQSLAQLLRAADKAMYEVKASHHAGFAFADELGDAEQAPLGTA